MFIRCGGTSQGAPVFVPEPTVFPSASYDIVTAMSHQPLALQFLAGEPILGRKPHIQKQCPKLIRFRGGHVLNLISWRLNI